MVDEILLLESTARTATTTSSEAVNRTGRGAVFVLDVTAKSSSPNISSLELQVKGADGGWVTFAQFSNLGIGVTGTWAFCVYPGAQDGFSQAALTCPLPRRFRAKLTHDNSDSITYSLKADILP